MIPLYARIDNLDPATGTRFTIESSEDFEFDQSLKVLSETRQQELATQFKRKADASYVEAKRSVVATQAKIPKWVGVALVLLGWNEFRTVITNPLYLSVTMMLGVPLAALWYMNMLGYGYLNMLGVIQTVGRNMLIGYNDDSDNRRDMHMLHQRPSSPQSHRGDTRGRGGDEDPGIELSAFEERKAL
jgi:hypothetical protein